MKKLLLVAFCLASAIINAQQFRYGFGISPSSSHLVLEGDLYDQYGKTFAFGYNILLDQTFGKKEHIGLSTGLGLDYTQCGMTSAKNQQGSEKEWEVRPEYLEVPLTLKLRTGHLSKFVFYVEGGAMAAKCLRARGDYTENGLRLDSDIDYTTGDSAGGLQYMGNNTALVYGGGTEISITETASLVIGFFVNKGFTDVFHDNNEDSDVMLQQAGVHIAGLF